MKRTDEQNKLMFWYLHQLGLDGEISRHALASQFSGGRVEKTSELSVDEANAMIEALKREYRKQLSDLRKKTVRLLYQIPIFIYKELGKVKLDEAKIREWMKKYSCKKKLMREYTLLELPCLYRQLQVMVRNYKMKAHAQNTNGQGREDNAAQ